LIAPHVIVASSAVNPPRVGGFVNLAVDGIGMQDSWGESKPKVGRSQDNGRAARCSKHETLPQ
jgi:hypothetical protein